MLVARAFTVVEFCRNFLARYKGIWELVRRIILGAVGLVIVYSILFSRREWILLALNFQRALELAVAVAILLFFLFAYYYHIAADPEVRSIGIGLFLFSASSVINNSILERLLHDYVSLWSLCNGISFLATLIIWTCALRGAQKKSPVDPVLLPEHIYGQFAPEVNRHLRSLNDRLGRFWNTEVPRP